MNADGLELLALEPQQPAHLGAWAILLLALLPAAGNFAGGLVAEFSRPSPRLLNQALHAASGIVLAIVAIELLPWAMGSLASWCVAAAFACGGVAYVALESAVQRLQQRARRAGAEAEAEGDGARDRSRMWMIYAAVALDLASDGLMVGTGFAASAELAIVLASGQVLADIPEGYAAVANFRDKGLDRTARLLAAGSFLVYAVVAALVAFFLLQGAPAPLKAAALAFVAGVLTVASVEDMLEEAHDAEPDTHRSVLAFVAGFTLFILVSAGIETWLQGSS